MTPFADTLSYSRKSSFPWECHTLFPFQNAYCCFFSSYLLITSKTGISFNILAFLIFIKMWKCCI